METVQETLKELDRNRLIANYLYNFAIDFNRPDLKERTVEEIKSEYHKILNDYIDRLVSIEPEIPEAPEERGLLFSHRVLKEFIDIPGCSLVEIGEFVKDPEHAKSYAFEFCKQSEIVGYLIADTPYTQDNIYDLMSQVLYEAAFFGYEQEDLQEELESLERATEEIKNGEYYEGDEVLAKLREEFGFEPEQDPETEEEEKLRSELYRIEYEYEKMTEKRERMKIFESLKGTEWLPE